MNDEEMRQILAQARTVAVVGISDKPERDSYQVGAYLLENGYEVLPVNPNVKQVLGRRSYGGLHEIGEPVDIVDVFRRSDAVMPIVDDAISIGAKVVWMQEGVVNEEAAKRARAAGLTVIMDHCMMQEHSRLFNTGGE